ncbi:MAG: hypothetical protein Kow0059_13900 [Candidatus Sumerlaeia bacterium]
MRELLAGPGAARDAARRLIEAGFNALKIPLMDEGFTLFPAGDAMVRTLAPRHPDLARRDVLGEMCDTASELGVPLLAGVEFLGAGDRGSGIRYPAFRRRRRWAMRNAAGRLHPLGPETQRIWLCPSRHEAVDLFAQVCFEAACGYPLAGLVLEMPEWRAADPQEPASDYCYCAACRRRILADLADGDDPAELCADGDFLCRRNWLFRQVIRGAVLSVRNRVLESRGDGLFFLQGRVVRADSALPVSPDTAWFGLAADGAAAGVFTTNYSFRGDDFAAELAADAQLFTAAVNVCPVLRSIRPETLIEQVHTLRAMGFTGFMAAHASDLSAEALERLACEALAWNGFFVEQAPLRAAESCLRRLLYLNAGCPPLQSFFRDTSRFLGQCRDRLGISDIEGVMDNLEHIRAQLARGAGPPGAPAAKVLRVLASLQKSLFMLCRTLRN